MNFDAAVVAAVTGHMNGDHPEDNLLIAKAFGYPEATAATMTGVDAQGGDWKVTDPAGEHEVRVPWPGGTISERPEIRREVVKLYKEACERLGVAPREEHGSAETSANAQGAHGGGHLHGGNPHGGNPHGGGYHGAHGARGANGSDAEADGPKPFSRVIRESSWGDHSSSEGSSFMEDIMRGKGTAQDYIDMSAQHYFMYEALEAAAEQLIVDPAYASFHPAALARLEALVADLEFLIGADWRDRIEAVPATLEYAARIREVAEEGWLPGVVAHHYTRYLGDLSGGQMIAKRVSRQHGYENEGVTFYKFEALGSIPDFKNSYRAGLDRLGETLDAEEQQRMVDEVRRAYSFNTAVFVDLARQKVAA